MNVNLISITPDAEKTMGYIARVSNPNNQDNPKIKKAEKKARMPWTEDAGNANH